MKYYIVALLDKESRLYVEKIQRTICRKYKLHNTDMDSTSYVFIETISDDNVQKSLEEIGNVLKPYKKFKVKINHIVSCHPEVKSLTLGIENEGYIVKISRKINESLKLHGLKINDEDNLWNFFVPLAKFNTNISSLPKESNELPQDKFLRIEKIELWKSINVKNKTLIKSFPLRDF